MSYCTNSNDVLLRLVCNLHSKKLCNEFKTYILLQVSIFCILVFSRLCTLAINCKFLIPTQFFPSKVTRGSVTVTSSE